MKPLFKCTCGNEFFTVKNNAVYCSCGMIYSFEELRSLPNKTSASPQKPCWKCKGTGKISKYFDAGDYFGAGTSPFSEWIDVACDICGE